MPEGPKRFLGARSRKGRGPDSRASDAARWKAPLLVEAPKRERPSAEERPPAVERRPAEKLLDSDCRASCPPCPPREGGGPSRRHLATPCAHSYSAAAPALMRRTSLSSSRSRSSRAASAAAAGTRAASKSSSSVRSVGDLSTSRQMLQRAAGVAAEAGTGLRISSATADRMLSSRGSGCRMDRRDHSSESGRFWRHWSLDIQSRTSPPTRSMDFGPTAAAPHAGARLLSDMKWFLPYLGGATGSGSGGSEAKSNVLGPGGGPGGVRRSGRRSRPMALWRLAIRSLHRSVTML
mmetsp:Transcript_76162/g.198659  ORF Transcript_76162/g.198659 Transcript_76162/m.198659 type:complete len:293 (-) Transcript_76162:423-1301(-)